jgi:hypothetical protein
MFLSRLNDDRIDEFKRDKMQFRLEYPKWRQSSAIFLNILYLFMITDSDLQKLKEQQELDTL